MPHRCLKGNKFDEATLRAALSDPWRLPGYPSTTRLWKSRRPSVHRRSNSHLGVGNYATAVPSMAQVATNTAMTTMTNAMFVCLDMLTPMMFCFNPFSRSASHWLFPLLQFSWRVFAGAESHTHPITDQTDRKSTRLNSSHLVISYAVFCLKTKK